MSAVGALGSVKDATRMSAGRPTGRDQSGCCVPGRSFAGSSFPGGVSVALLVIGVGDERSPSCRPGRLDPTEPTACAC